MRQYHRGEGMKQPTIYDQLKELKSMHYDDRRLINAAFAEIEKLKKQNDHLKNEIEKLTFTLEFLPPLIQGIDKIYAEAHGKTPILTPEEHEPQHLVPVEYGLRELNKLMVAKFGKAINREDFLFPLLKNEYINYSVHKRDNSRTYYPLKRGIESGWIGNDTTFVKVTQKGLSEIIAYLNSKGFVEVSE